MNNKFKDFYQICTQKDTNFAFYNSDEIGYWKLEMKLGVFYSNKFITNINIRNLLSKYGVKDINRRLV